MAILDFYPRPPRGGRPASFQLVSARSRDFYPRPPRGGRPSACAIPARQSRNFYPRPPRGGRRSWQGWSGRSRRYFYPRPPRGGRPIVKKLLQTTDDISIHALREEGDAARLPRLAHSRYFYPRPPRGGRPGIFVKFHRHILHFYPRPPRGGRLSTAWMEQSDTEIFLSTPSARRATNSFQCSQSSRLDFYPRPPRGGRQQKQRQNLYFQTNYTTFCTNLEEP